MGARSCLFRSLTWATEHERGILSTFGTHTLRLQMPGVQLKLIGTFL